jgi:type IV secretory pathway TrbD component
MGIDTLQDFRDVTIISFTIAGTVLFLVGIILAIVIGGGLWALVRRLRHMAGNLEPTLENVRDTSLNVRNTVAFISENAVTPVVRTYGIIAGARRFIVVVSRFTRSAGD